MHHDHEISIVFYISFCNTLASTLMLALLRNLADFVIGGCAERCDRKVLPKAMEVFLSGSKIKCLAGGSNRVAQYTTSYRIVLHAQQRMLQT
jgi:hypothetical protein